ncbi:MAG: carbohydrate ABC transporter permease [Clostridiales bacterium]|nr:carbohydrate ABC transporter permease [Clostridiales bacterium]
MSIKRSVGERIFDTFNVVFMIFLMAITLYPFIHVAFASISLPSKLMSHRGPILLPLGVTINAYKLVFRDPMILIGYENTLFYVIVGTALNILMTCLGAYVLSRRGLYLQKVLMVLIVFTMYFGGGLIPFYLIVKALKLTNTRWSVIVPTAISTWNLIIMRTAFMGIPDSIEESAKIDGAQDFTILFRIIIPLSIPTIAVMILFYGVGHWNAWFNAMIFIRKRELYPLQLRLREILIMNDTSNMLTEVADIDEEPVGETVKYATIMVSTIPILLVYPSLQKYFVDGIMIGALKG